MEKPGKFKDLMDFPVQNISVSSSNAIHAVRDTQM